MKNTLLIFLLILSSSITLLYSAYTGWYSYAILWFSLLLFTNKFFFFFYKNDYKIIIRIFLIVYSFYSIYMNITNFIYVDNPSYDFFMMVDSMKFWDYSNYNFDSYSNLIEIFINQAPLTQRYILFNFQSLNLAFFAQIFDENNILIQKLPSVFLGAISIPYIYLSIKNFVDSKRAYNYSLFFGIFSFVCIYSIVFNRDPQVYFLYTIGTYIIINYRTVNFGFLKLIILLILTCGFRLEHGLFFSLFVFIYLLAKSNRNPVGKVFLISLISLCSLVIFPYVFSKLSDTTEAYENKRDGVERSGSSAGASIAKLPFGVKHVLLAINGQLAPAIPFWRGWYIDNANLAVIKYPHPGYFTPWRFMESIAAVSWIYVWGFLLYGFKKFFKNLNAEVKYLFYFALLLIFATTSSIDVRRMYCIYPIIFIVFCIFYSKMNKIQKNKVLKFVSVFLIFIYTAYFLIK